MERILKITLDLMKGPSYDLGTIFTQNDSNTHYLQIEFKDKELNLVGKKIRVNFIRANGTVVFSLVDISSEIIKILVPTNALEIPGDLGIEITLIDEDKFLTINKIIKLKVLQTVTGRDVELIPGDSFINDLNKLMEEFIKKIIETSKEEIEKNSNEQIAKIKKEGEVQLEILKYASEGLPDRMTNLEEGLQGLILSNDTEHQEIKEEIERNNTALESSINTEIQTREQSINEVKNRVEEVAGQNISTDRIPNNSIPASKLESADDTRKIKLINLSEEVKNAMTGKTPIAPDVADGSVGTTKLADEGVTYKKLRVPIRATLTPMTVKDNVVTIPQTTSRIIFTFSGGRTENPYNQRDKETYTLDGTNGQYLVFDTSDNTTKQVKNPTSSQYVLLVATGTEITGGLLSHQFTAIDKPIGISTYGRKNLLFSITLDKITPPITVTFPTNYKFEINYSQGRITTNYISASGQNVFTINVDEKLVLEDGKFKVVPISYKLKMALEILSCFGTVVSGLFYEEELKRRRALIPRSVTVPYGYLIEKSNSDGSVVIENPEKKTTYAKNIYISMAGDYEGTTTFQNITETSFTLQKGDVLFYNTLTKQLVTRNVGGGSGYLRDFNEDYNEILLAQNVNGKITNGAFLPYIEEYHRNYNLVVKAVSPYKWYDFGSTQGIVVIGNELWTCFHSNDEHTDFANNSIYNKETGEHIKNLPHNLGHLNTLSYNSNNDSLLITNSSKSYALPPKLYILPNASQLSKQDRLDFNTIDKIELDVSYLYNETGESKANPCWATNSKDNNAIYIVTNDNKIVREIALGKGANQLEKGNFISGKGEEEYNGTFKEVRKWEQKDGRTVNAGLLFYKGVLYTAGRFDDRVGLYAYELTNNGNINTHIVSVWNSVDSSGGLWGSSGQGVCEDGDDIYFFTDSAGCRFKKWEL